MFFLTNRSVIFCVIHVRHCELFGSLLSLAISEPRLCCSETLLHCKSPQLYSELSHLYFLRCIFKKIILISLPRSIYYVIQDFQINTCTDTCVKMIRWQIQCNTIPQIGFNGFRHASFLKTDGDWFYDVFDFVEWQHMYQSISIYGSGWSYYIRVINGYW